MAASFIELHARSAFSFLRGASLPEDLVGRAAALGQRALGLCDHLGFAGSARAHQAAAAAGLRALVGTTLEVAVPGTTGGGPIAAELPLLCATRAGYSALCQLLTRQLARQAGEDRPPRGAGCGVAGRLPLGSPDQPAWEFVAAVPRGALVALTGDRDGPVCRALLRDDPRAAQAAAEALVAAFGAANVHVEIVRHGLRDEARLHRQLRDLAGHLRLPLLASNAPLHATRADRPLADAFACLRHHTTLDRAGTLLAPNGERHLRSAAAMAERFADLPEALANTRRLAARLEFTLEDLGYRFPSFRDPETGRALPRDEEARLLRQLTLAGAADRYGALTPPVRRQLDHELALIAKLGFAGYFLIVHELVRFARGQGILCQGRGSAANSAVCYALGITAVDPVGGGLLFERFLSENRRTWPDIDLDLPSGDQRERVIQHLFEAYAPHGAAMTANVITYRPRSAFREMTKVLGFPPCLADRFSDIRSSPRPADPREPDPAPDAGPPPAAADHGLFQQAGIPRSHPRFPALARLYQAVLRLPRHLGQHPGGMVICDAGLDRLVPLQPAAMPGRTILQWDKDDCEDLGIVKVDLLGLGMLAAIEDALHRCAARGRPVDLARIPKDDPAVFDLLCRADTVGTFQVESRAQMATLPIMKPRTFYDLAIEVAIIRPGPIVGDLVHPYLNRRNGREPVDCIHPAFEPILARTLGVPLFQEQVLRMAMTLAGFNGAEADELRRAMAFKRSDERMEAVTAKLRRRMGERGVAAGVQDKVAKAIGSFALYGFPESHAISFALIAYASCWLKVHRPAEFYAGLVNCQPMGFYSVNTLIQDARRHRIRVRPVSCVHSGWKTTVVDDAAIRLGLHRLKGLSRQTADRLLAARADAPFAGLADFLRRARPTKTERRLLATAGALNDLPGVAHRRDALWQAELPLREGEFQVSSVKCQVRDREDAYQPAPGPLETSNLKPDTPIETSNLKPETSPLMPMTGAERLAADLAAQGATTGPHPMRLWRGKFQVSSVKCQVRDREDAYQPAPGPLETSNLKPDTPIETSNLKPETPPLRASDLHALGHGAAVEVAGMVICRQRPGTARGHCFISLEDETGIANLFVPRATFHKFRLVITTEAFLLARGRLQRSEGDQPTVYTTDLQPLPGIDSALSAASHDFH